MSGLGLIAVVAWGLWDTVREQSERASDAALRDAERTARDLRRWLEDPAVLEAVPEAWRFTVAAGDLVVPDDLAPLSPTIDFSPEFEVDAGTRDQLDDALGREYATAALEQLEKVVADDLRDPAAASWVDVRAAWKAHELGASELRDRWLAGVDPGVNAVAAASAALLHAAIGDPLPEWVGETLARLPWARAVAVLDRLAMRGVDVTALRAERDALGHRRALLRTVRPLLPALMVRGEPSALHCGEGTLLVYHPAAAAGFVTDDHRTLSERIEQWRSEARFDGSGSALTILGVSPDGAVPVVGGVLAVAPVTVDRGWLAGPVGMALLAIALAAICGGGAFLAFRAVRREADATRARAEFLTTVTHELKTPLAGIRLLTEMLTDGRVADHERQVYVQRLAAEAVRLSMLIENVLDLGRIERGERVHDPRVADLVEVVRGTVELFAPLAERDGIEVTFDGEGEPVLARVDRDALRQVLLNLLDNARKYAAGGGHIEVRVRRHGDRAVVAVRDHGPGIDPHERRAIFERFRRGEAHRHGATPGVGLGLALARAIARRHGGDLDVVEAPGPGACFELCLPIEARQREEPAA